MESLFAGSNTRDEDVILRLRDENKDDIGRVVQIVLSHARVGTKNNLILAIIEYLRPMAQTTGVSRIYGPMLRKLSELDSRSTAKIALKSREVLIQCAMPSFEERTSQMEHILRTSVVETEYGGAGLPHRNPEMTVLRELIRFSL